MTPAVVKLWDKNANDVMQIVREMREQGLVQGKDFDFAYNKPTFDNSSYEAVERRHTVFTFYDSKWATWFLLKWNDI